MVLRSACRLTNIEMLQKAMGHHLGYPEIFSCCTEVFYNSGREKIYKKNTSWWYCF